MKSRASIAFILLFSATVQGVVNHPLVPQEKKEVLEAEFLEKPEQPGFTPTANISDAVLVERMKGLLLLGNLDEILNEEDVEGVIFKDLKVPGSQIALVEKLRPYIIGQPLTQNTIADLRREITLFYQENDHPVVSVIVPEQDVTDGVLQIGVIEGKIGKVSAKGGKYFGPARMQGKFHLQEGDTINTDDLLSDVAWANQNPFRQTNIIFYPGQLSGTTDVEIVTNDRTPLRVYIGGDNTGNHFTGRNRWYAGFNWGDVFGLDQTLSFQYTTSSDFSKLQSYTANYTIPLPWHNILTFFGGYTRVHPDMPKIPENDGLKSHGWSGQASVRYVIPFGKTYGIFLQNFQAGYDYKVTNNTLEFAGNEVSTKTAHISQFLASYYAGWTPNSHKMNADIDVYFSPGNWFGDENKKAFSNLERGAKTSYVYTRLAFGDEFVFPRHNWGLYGLARAQFSSSTLLPSEQYGLGGYDTVRGYEQRAVNYDNAFNLNFEVRAPSFSLLHLCGAKYKTDTLTFLAFIDYGMGWPHDQKGVDSLHHLDPKFHNLVGIGPGLRYRIGPWFYARLDYGVPLISVNGKGHTPVLDFGLLASY
ncbi:MAG: ShlB/FhaC/HecB family hemolysin secretion/activation protein [Chlamydiota bacterium]